MPPSRAPNLKIETKIFYFFHIDLLRLVDEKIQFKTDLNLRGIDYTAHERQAALNLFNEA